jgi:putative hydrolase of the HAD superfamily
MTLEIPSRRTRAVFFDVDFTLIRPGRAFQGPGYQEFCARHGVEVDADAFDAAVLSASTLLDAGGGPYDPAIFIEYTRRIIERMGGRGAAVDKAARDIYDEWSACHHFILYDEVPEVLRALHDDGFTIGLISNTQRPLATFERHFALDGLFAVAISSSDHGYMKPHPSIFQEALRRVAVQPAEAVMVGDSVAHDIEGARRLGMRGVLVARSGLSTGCPPDIPVIHSLRELRALL